MIMAAQDKEVVGAASYDFLMFSGYASMAYQWLRMANVALSKQKEATTQDEKDFYQAKFDVAQFYFDRILPRTKTLHKTILASPKTLMKMKEESF